MSEEEYFGKILEKYSSMTTFTSSEIETLTEPCFILSFRDDAYVGGKHIPEGAHPLVVLLRNLLVENVPLYPRGWEEKRQDGRRPRLVLSPFVLTSDDGLDIRDAIQKPMSRLVLTNNKVVSVYVIGFEQPYEPTYTGPQFRFGKIDITG